MASQNTYTTAPDSNYPRRFPFTFPSLDSSEVYVSVAGTLKTVGASNDYTLGNYNKTSGGYIEFVSDTTRGTGTVRVYRLTDGSTLKRDFQAGSAIKADDLNTANKQAIYLAEEARQEFVNLAASNTASGFAIDGSNIAPGSVTSNKIADLQVKAVDLSSSTTDDTERAVTTNHIRDNAVTTAKVADLNVTTAKIANTNVTTAKIADGAVTQAKINSAVIFTPVGTVITYAGSTAPTGYLKSNGDTIPNGTGTVQGVTADFSALYAVVGATLPDLRGEFIRGWSDGRTENGSDVDSGRQIRSSQTDENKQHNHSISVSGTTSNKSLTGGIRKISEGFRANGSASGVFTKTNDGNSSITGSSSNSPVSGVNINASHSHTFTASGTSGNQGSESRPRNVALLMCIKY